MKNIFSKSVVVFIIIVSGFSCDTVTGPTDRNPTIRTITTYQGSWTGTTSQGFPMSFTVIGNTVTGFQIDKLQSVNGQPATQFTFFSLNNVIIIGSDFTIKLYLNAFDGQNANYSPGSANGHFTSTTTAEGITATDNSATDVTWKAEKK
jgi:hypothetical protein